MVWYGNASLCFILDEGLETFLEIRVLEIYILLIYMVTRIQNYCTYRLLALLLKYLERLLQILYHIKIFLKKKMIFRILEVIYLSLPMTIFVTCFMYYLGSCQAVLIIINIPD